MLNLTVQGEQQALAVGRFLKQYSIQHGFTSPYLRARKTAELANKELAIAIDSEPLFSERVLFASDTVSEEQSKNAFENSQNDWDYHTESGESLNAVVDRFTKAVDATLMSNVPLKRLVVFTHGRALQSYLHSVFPNDGFGESALSIPSAGIYRVDYTDGKPSNVSLLFVPLITEKWANTAVPTLADTIVRNIKNATIHKSHLTPDRMASNVQKNIYEIKSLDYLASIGIKIPGNRLLVENGAFMQMDYIAGKTLGETISSSGNHTYIIYETGKLLRKIHDAITTNSPLSTLLVNPADGTINAQCALNVNELTLPWLEKYSADQHDSVLIEVLGQVRSVLNNHPEYLISSDIIYGDFKPDNIIVGDVSLYCIDPHLSYGRRSCDVAKMIARLYLANPVNAKEQVAHFLDGYDRNEHIEEIYHMAAFDILNTYSRLLAKNLLTNQLTISSHRKTVEHITTCIEVIVPKLLRAAP